MLLKSVLDRKPKMLFFHGKGGVGKSSMAIATALALKQSGKNVLLAMIQNPWEKSLEGPDFVQGVPVLKVDFLPSLHEYITLKLKNHTMSDMLVHNALFERLAKVTPGLSDLVALGKPWFEVNHYDMVLLDMPSTGHGLTMIQSVANFATLFGSGVLFQDAHQMKLDLGSGAFSLHIWVCLAQSLVVGETMEAIKQCGNFYDLEQMSLAVILNKLWPADSIAKGSGTEGRPEFVFGRAKLLEQDKQIKILEEGVAKLKKTAMIERMPFFIEEDPIGFMSKSLG